MTIIYFVLILGITVFIHELGHFMFAKKYGVHVYEFSIGMGPKLFKFNRKNDETDYCIRLLPIGGFVQMAGEEVEVDEDIPEEKRLTSKPPFQRFMIMIAGVMMNFLLAIVLLFGISLFAKTPTNTLYITNPNIKGVNAGDKIVAINDNFVNNYDKFALEMAIVDNKEFTMTLKDKQGKKYDVNVEPIKVGEDKLPYLKDYGFSVSQLTINDSDIKELNKGDEIIKINDKEIEDYLSLLSVINECDKEFTLTIKDKKDKIKDIKIEVSDKKEDSILGVSFGFSLETNKPKGLFDSIKYAFTQFISSIEQMIFTVVYLITGKISLGMMSGPIGICNGVDAYSTTGIVNIISLLCLICINVGFINILPFPAFDGGHVVFIIIEKIKGSKVDPKIENTIHNIGFILLMILMVVITYNDIIKFF